MDVKHIDVERWVDNFNQQKKSKKRPRLRKFMIAFGAFIIPFVLITSLVLPIFDDRRGLDILLSYLGGDEEPVEPLGADAWLGISSAELDSLCGEAAGYELANALDGGINWKHYVDEVHWFVLDLGQTYTIKKLRSRSNSPDDPIDVNIYIDDSNPPTTLCEEGITTWQDTDEWVEITLTTEGTGRYIKVEIEDTEDAARNIRYGRYTTPWTIFDAYGDVAGPPANNAPTQTGESPTNGSTNVDVSGGVPDLYVICNDADAGDTMNATWRHNATGDESWATFATNSSISPTTNITQSNANFSTESTTYWWSVNLSDGTAWTNATYHFTTSANDTITFNFISMTPSDILINSTGELLITYNVTTASTGLNKTSLLIAHVLNNTRIAHQNNTYTLYAENWIPDKKCAINRNYPYWFETELSYLTGDDTIGDIGEWAVHNETLYENITINSQGATWINFTHNITILENLFGNIFLVNREAQTIENKTGQTFDVYKDIACRIAFNMSNTQWWNDTEYNNTYYTLHFYAEAVSPDKDLFVYFANDSYTTGNPLTSEYCELIGTVTTGQSYDYTVLNSSYYDVSFSSDANGSIGSVGMTENFSFIFASNAKDSTHKWIVYYADDNITIIDEYHDFKNSSSSMTCINKGVTWITQDGTIDAFLTYGHLENIDRIMYKVYCQMDGTATGDGQWSDVIIDVLDESNLPPNIPNVITPNGTITDYSIGDTINVTYSWLGDPNLDTCWLNITAVNATDVIVHYIQNRSITPAEYEINNTWWYDWNTTGLLEGGAYHINITATDDQGLYRYTGLDGIFWLNTTWQNVNTTINGAFTNVSTKTWQNVDTTYNGAFTNTTTWQDVDTSMNGAFTNTTTWQNVNTSINGIFTNATVWQDVDTSINGEFTNVSIRTWQVVNDTINGAFTNISIRTWQDVNTTVNGEFTNTTVWHDVNTSINGAFTNTTIWYNVDTSINGVFINTTTWQNVDVSINGEFTNVSIRVWQNVNDTINGAFTNTTLWYNVDTTYNGEFTNTTTWQDVDTAINGEFTNVSIVSNITITNEYPTNGSTDVQVNTSLHFTVSNALGYTMNISVYTGSNLTNCSALLGSFNSVSNGTYYLGYHNASEVSTNYSWRVNVTDAYGNYADETYNFTTASTTGDIYMIGGAGRYGMGMVMAFSMAFGMLFLMVGLLWKRKRRRKE